MVRKFNHSIDKYFINYKFNQASNLIWIRRYFVFLQIREIFDEINIFWYYI